MENLVGSRFFFSEPKKLFFYQIRERERKKKGFVLDTIVSPRYSFDFFAFFFLFFGGFVCWSILLFLILFLSICLLFCVDHFFVFGFFLLGMIHASLSFFFLFFGLVGCFSLHHFFPFLFLFNWVLFLLLFILYWVWFFFFFFGWLFAIFYFIFNWTSFFNMDIWGNLYKLYFLFLHFFFSTK